MHIHILLAVDARQVLGCAVSMRSVLEHVRAGAEVHFHLMTDGVPDRDRAALRETVAGSGRPATLALYDVDVSRFEHLMRSKLISHTAYARLLLDEVLPTGVERCIYLDCDMVVVRDIAEAWTFDLQGLTLAAVEDGKEVDARAHQERLGLAAPRYFNSGFAVIDVARWRARGVSASAIAHAERVGDRLVLHDQDAMNCALEGDWVPLPNEWNAHVPFTEWLREDSEAVFHYTSAPKPWSADYDRRFGALFYRYLDLTAYAGHRPWNPLGLGALVARTRRRFPYLPTVIRVLFGER